MTFKMPVADALAVLRNYYTNGDEYSVAKGVPMAYLDSVREAVKILSPGRRVRIRYRGSRTNPLDLRPRCQRYQDCLKKFATSFTVYID